MKRSELFFTFLLVPLDCLMIFLSFLLAYWWRSHQEVIYMWPLVDYLQFILALLPFWVIIFTLAGLYRPVRYRGFLDQFASIFLSVSSGIMLVVGWIFLSRTFFFSRLVLIYAWVLTLLLVIVARWLIKQLQIYLYKFGIGARRLIIIGNGNKSVGLVRIIRATRGLGYKIIGFVLTPNDKALKDKNILVLGNLSEFEKIIQKHPADEVILTDPNLSENKTSQLIDICQEKHLVFKQTPNIFHVKAANAEISALSSIPIIEFHHTPLEGWGKILKRIVDIIGSFIGLVILSPLFLFAAIVIKIVSPGPVIFKQQRVREDGSVFAFYKFRTMYCGAEKEHQDYMKKYGVMFKLEKDPRVIPLGDFLRKSSIDELPQLYNVLRGDMSLVGPRPPMPEEVKYYSRWQKKRLGVKPGITGLWQVSGRSDVNFDNWVKLDVYYVENWSLWLDLKILLKTFWIVLVRKGAY